MECLWLAVGGTYNTQTHTHRCRDRDVDYNVFQIGKTSKPKALDETRWNKNVFHSAKLLKKRDWMR